jgi:hypothetical protein
MQLRTSIAVPLLLSAMLALAGCAPVGVPTPSPAADAQFVAAIQSTSHPITQPSTSPDGRWQVDLASFGCTPVGAQGNFAYEALSLGQGSGDSASVVDSQLIACGGLGAYGFDSLFWSPNSRYFYYTTARDGVPDGCGFWQPPIRRLDATSGAIQDLGAGWVSPDGSRIATWLERTLLLWDVDQGELARLPAAEPGLPLIAAGWAPDGRAFAYLQAPSPCDPSAAGNSAVVRVDAVELAHSILLQTESPTFTGLQWQADGELRLVDSDGQAWTLSEEGLVAQPQP